MSDAWTGGSTRAWRKLRAAVLLRDAYRCRCHADGWCAGAPAHDCTRVATTAHHVRGRKLTGDDPAYVVAACAPCNLAVGDPMKAADPPCVPVTRW